MAKCNTCKNALYNPIWGEHKCSKTGLCVYDIDKKEDCEKYEQGEPGMSKDLPEER